MHLLGDPSLLAYQYKTGVSDLIVKTREYLYLLGILPLHHLTHHFIVPLSFQVMRYHRVVKMVSVVGLLLFSNMLSVALFLQLEKFPGVSPKPLIPLLVTR